MKYLYTSRWEVEIDVSVKDVIENAQKYVEEEEGYGPEDAEHYPMTLVEVARKAVELKKLFNQQPFATSVKEVDSTIKQVS
jgi:hypothetical protein